MNILPMYKRQLGAVLIVGLVMMLLLTVIGLAAIRGTDLQERMAGNMRDRNLAFQAAEGALRSGEEILNGNTLPSFLGATRGYWPDLNDAANTVNLTVGSWPQMDGTNVRRLKTASWLDSQWEVNTVRLPDDSLEGLAQQPRYFIEKIVVAIVASNLGHGADIVSQAQLAETEYYRVSARGQGGTLDAEVVLQSTFAR
jgi:type IV pilus assembly protein PilX